MKQTLLHSISRIGFAASLAALFIYAAGASAGTYRVNDTEDSRAVRSRVEASQFLSYATFGPTADEIEALSARITKVGRRPAFEEWIETQFALPATLHKPLARKMVEDDGLSLLDEDLEFVVRYRTYAWWHAALDAKDQLRQRAAWALSQIFVVNDTGLKFNGRRLDTSGEPRWLGLSDYYDILVRNAFGNYRDTLGEVTLHPIMGVFLSHVNNSKGDPSTNLFPDENYAREVMQLFSIGLYKLNTSGVIVRDHNGNPIETYDNNDIQSFARVFTGLTFAGEYRFSAKDNYNQPMQMIEERHDTGKKILLNGKVLPPGQSGMQDIEAALDSLYRHRNTGPFLARRLIQRFVKSNPSRGYIRRVASAFNDNGQGVRGDFKAVIKAILLDPEVWQSQTYQQLRRPARLKVVSEGTEHTRMREPILRYAAFIRAFNPSSEHHTGRFLLPSLYKDMNQAPYKAPSVFNFYLSDYQPPGEILDLAYIESEGFDQTTRIQTTIPDSALFAPEFQILTSPVANEFANRLRSNVYNAKARFELHNTEWEGPVFSTISLDFSNESKLASNPPALMEHLDLLLCHGTMGDNVKQIIEDVIATETTDNLQRAQGAILATLTSPACSVSN